MSRHRDHPTRWRASVAAAAVLAAWVAVTAVPARAPLRPAVLFVHGGGWVRGDPAPADQAFAARLAERTGWIVAVASYPAVQPFYVNQPRAIARQLAALRARSGVDPHRVVLWGESAGALLSLVTAYRHPRAVAAVVSDSGPTDMTQTFAGDRPWFVATYEGPHQPTPTEQPDRYKRTSPVNQLGAGAPPTFQAASAADPHVPSEQVRELDAQLAADGVRHQTLILPGTAHAPETDRVVRAALAFLRSVFTDVR